MRKSAVLYVLLGLLYVLLGCTWPPVYAVDTTDALGSPKDGCASTVNKYASKQMKQAPREKFAYVVCGAFPIPISPGKV